MTLILGLTDRKFELVYGLTGERPDFIFFPFPMSRVVLRSHPFLVPGFLRIFIDLGMNLFQFQRPLKNK